MKSVGRNVPRKEGLAKVTGAAKYIDDLRFPGMLHGRTIRSTIARGEIASIRVDAPGCVVADHRDIPGKNVVAMIEHDQPCLVEKEIRHREEPILLLAGDRDAIREAKVEIDYRPAEPNFDPTKATDYFKAIAIDKGKVERGFAESDLIVEGEYRTGAQEHAYIETNGVIAVPENEGITLYGSLQCPYYVLKSLQVLLGTENVRVVQVETGGGFGGKEDYPSVIAGHAAILALKAKRPVKIVYDRAEDMVATTKRHPSIVRHKTGVKKDGTLVSMEIEVLLDGGAYTTLSPVVLSRGVIHATGPYRCPNVRIIGRAAMTNTPPNGAFRGFGAPQTQFAAEVHMERIAEELGMDSVKLRAINALRPGDRTATHQRLGDDASAIDCLREAVRRMPRKPGVGYSLFFHGSGFTGGGEIKLASKAALELTERGARIRVASTEIGQGTRTMLAQIVADTLGVGYDDVEVAPADTAEVPDTGPTVASRTCMIVGGILQRCAQEMKARIGKLTPRQYLRKHGPLVITKQYDPPGELHWDEKTYYGDAYGAFGWGCTGVELEVDPDTYEVRLKRIVTVQDIGKAIHPVLAKGQIEGGTVQGLGFALLEEVVMRNGRMANGQLTNYIIPTTMDVPRIETVILEKPYAYGPFGAKGVGEMPMNGAPPAVVNALRNLGFDVREVPATPEKLMRALRPTS